jgi:hypothetical protein
MGLHVHSLSNIPKSANRDYWIYLLEYGWHEPLGQALEENFSKMAARAADTRAVVIKGTDISHFENEVFSWHKINNEQAGDILPAILKQILILHIFLNMVRSFGKGRAYIVNQRVMI